MITVRVYGDDPELRGGKPSPEPFLLAAERLRAAPAECWAFEDSQAGLQAAVTAGCRVFALVPDLAAGAALTVPEGVTVLRSLEEVAL